MSSFLSQLKRRWLLVTAIVVIGALVWYAVQSHNPRVNGSKTYKVSEHYLQDSLSLSGEIDAQEMATLRFQTSGLLTWVGVKEGDHVKKYQGIAALDVRDVKNKLTQYLNTYSSVRDSYDQSVDDNLRTMNEGSTQEVRNKAKRLLDEAQNNLNNSVLDVELQKLAQEYSYLSTPIDGVVVEALSPVAGVNITPAQAEFIVINPDTLYFSATADQTDVPKLHEGMAGDVTFDSFPDKTFSGKILSIAFVPDENETGTVYRVKISLAPQSSDFRMKMTGDVNFPVGEKRLVLEVPTSIIKTENSKEYVIANVGGKQVKTFIKTGDTDGDMTEVVSGLQKGELVYD